MRLLSGDFVMGLMTVFLRAVVFFFKQKTAYEMRISDWSSDVCSSDLFRGLPIRIEQLSRMVTAKSATATKKGLADGTVDIVIGTHAVQIGSASCRERVCQYV